MPSENMNGRPANSGKSKNERQKKEQMVELRKRGPRNEQRIHNTETERQDLLCIIKHFTAFFHIII